jgi:hypothetical protein
MPNKRIPPSERLSKEIMELVNNFGNNHDKPQEIFGQIVQLSVRKLVQGLLEKTTNRDAFKSKPGTVPDLNLYLSPGIPGRNS